MPLAQPGSKQEQSLMVEMNEIDTFDEDTINELRKRARAALLTEAFAKEVFDMTHVTQLFPLFDTTDAAVQSL